MGLLDMLMPGSGKAGLRADIDELNRLALAEADRQGLPPKRAVLWEACCNQASDIVVQLFLDNSSKQLDWGLKGKRKKLNRPRLTAVYWWMLLYQIVLFKRRGVDGYHSDDEFSELSQAAHVFIEELASSYEDVVNPGPWEARWQNQMSLEASLGMYNGVMAMLGLRVDADARIMRVSLFTSATEQAFDTNIKRAVAERNGTS